MRVGAIMVTSWLVCRPPLGGPGSRALRGDGGLGVKGAWEGDALRERDAPSTTADSAHGVMCGPLLAAQANSEQELSTFEGAGRSVSRQTEVVRSIAQRSAAGLLAGVWRAEHELKAPNAAGTLGAAISVVGSEKTLHGLGRWPGLVAEQQLPLSVTTYPGRSECKRGLGAGQPGRIRHAEDPPLH